MKVKYLHKEKMGNGWRTRIISSGFRPLPEFLVPKLCLGTRAEAKAEMAEGVRKSPSVPRGGALH
jgi:hypothetical protein